MHDDSLPKELDSPNQVLQERNVLPNLDGLLIRYSDAPDGKQKWYIHIEENSIYAKVRKGNARKAVYWHEGERVAFDLAVESHENTDQPRYYAENVRPFERKRRQK